MRVCAICGIDDATKGEATYGYRFQLHMLGVGDGYDKAHPSCVRKAQREWHRKNPKNHRAQEWDSNVRRQVRRALNDAILAIDALADSSEKDPVMNHAVCTVDRLRKLRDKLKPGASHADKT